MKDTQTLRQFKLAEIGIYNCLMSDQPEKAVKYSEVLTVILKKRAKEKADRKRELVQK